MRAYIVYIFILLFEALMITSCSSNTIIEEEDVIDSADPIRFSNASEQAVTRASVPNNLLKTGFLVSTYKNFSSDKWNNSTLALSTVMDCYRVDYKEDRNDWEGKVESFWNYIGIEGQKEKYWDLSAYPYRFHAIAPAHGNAVPDRSAVILSNDHLKLTATYSAQQYVAPAKDLSAASASTIAPNDATAEPYLIAQMQRDDNGADYDIIKSAVVSDASSGSSVNKVRQIPLPFHHLNCKVRFCVYTNNTAQTDRSDYITDMTIWSEHLATSATGYEAFGENAWISQDGYSYFQGINVPADRVELIKFNHNGTTRSYEQNDLSLHQTKTSAYYFECPNGIMQLPQDNVKLHVSMQIHKKDGTLDSSFLDYVLSDIGTSAGISPFHWIAGNIYTYYLHLNFDYLKLPIITTTCTVTPWEDVIGSISTDLEQ